MTMQRFGWPVLILCIAVAALTARTVASESYIKVTPNIQLYVRDEGHGSPVVVLNGGPGLGLSYIEPDLQPLVSRHRVIFFDQRGAGHSTIISRVTATQLVSDLEVLRQRLHLDQMTLLGHSWGGGLAALYAMAYPRRVERMILVDAIPPRVATLRAFQTRLSTRLSSDQRDALDTAAQARQSAATPAAALEACQTYWNILLQAYYTNEAALARSHGDFCDGPSEAQMTEARMRDSVLASLGMYDWRWRLANIRVPTLVIQGSNDPIPFESAEDWAGNLRNARLFVLDHAGHMSYVDDPDRFFDAVETFLRGDWPASAARVRPPAPAVH